MAIIITLDEVLTKRQLSLTELAELVQRSLANVGQALWKRARRSRV